MLHFLPFAFQYFLVIQISYKLFQYYFQDLKPVVVAVAVTVAIVAFHILVQSLWLHTKEEEILLFHLSKRELLYYWLV